MGTDKGSTHITKELVRFCSTVSFDQLPDEVIDRVKYRFLDFIGVTCRGSLIDSSQSAYKFVRKMDTGTHGGVIVGTNERSPYVYAALANGIAAHAIEMDDVNNEPSLHPSAVIYPTALAAGEMCGTPGRKFIEAVVAGYETMVRIGTGLQPEFAYRRGFHPTGVCGVFGACVAASKTMELENTKVLSGMGIAGSQASGSMEYLAQGAWTKRFHPGWAAHNGIIAALISREGFQGPTSIIEGRDGFLHAYTDKADYHKVLEKLGTEYKILQTSVKPHPCCRFMHPPIDAILETIQQHAIRPDQVKKVNLGILKGGARLVAEPKEDKYNPKSVVDAQFSIPYGAAVAVLYGKVGMDEFEESMIKSDDVRSMMGRIEYFEDPELDKEFPRKWCGTAEIITTDGNRYFTKVEYPKGDPENPLTWEEMIERFNDLSSVCMSKERRRDIITNVQRLEEIDDIQQWSALLLSDI